FSPAPNHLVPACEGRLGLSPAQTIISAESRQPLAFCPGAGPNRLNIRTVPTMANAMKPARTYHMGVASGLRSGWRFAWSAKLIVKRMTEKRAQPNQEK